LHAVLVIRVIAPLALITGDPLEKAMNMYKSYLLALTLLLISQDARGQAVVISQLYGGGGNTGSTLRNDFIELFNRGNAPVNLTGWSVQYASAAGSSWDRTLLSATIGPGQYFLIQEAQGNGGSSSLPPSDATGEINLSAISGKIALVSNSNNLSASSPAGPQIVDFVGYGAANFAEGKPADALTKGQFRWCPLEVVFAPRHRGRCTSI
jgi:hypothetical protein